MKMLRERERQTDAPVSLSTLKTAVDRGSRSDHRVTTTTIAGLCRWPPISRGQAQK